MSEEELQSLPGIGKDLAHKIRQFVDTAGSMPRGTAEKDPRGLLEILRVPGIGPKTARLLFDKKNVKSLEELETLARSRESRRPAGNPGEDRGEHPQGDRASSEGDGAVPSGQGASASPGGSWSFYKRPFPAPGSALAGASRRWKETVKDIDILAAGKMPEVITKAFVGLPGTREVLERERRNPRS